MSADTLKWLASSDQTGSLRPTVHLFSQDVITGRSLFTAATRVAEANKRGGAHLIIVPAPEAVINNVDSVLDALRGNTPFKRGMAEFAKVFAPYNEIRGEGLGGKGYDAFVGRFTKAFIEQQHNPSRGKVDALRALASTGAAILTQEDLSTLNTPSTVLQPEKVTAIWPSDDPKSSHKKVIFEAMTARTLHSHLHEISPGNVVIMPAQYGTYFETDVNMRGDFEHYPAKLSGTTDAATGHQAMVTARLINAEQVRIWTAPNRRYSAPNTLRESREGRNDIPVYQASVDHPETPQEISFDRK